VISIFDCMETTKDGRWASGISKTWNDAWYQSKHWREDISIPFVNARTSDALCRSLKKSGWSAKRVSFDAVILPVPIFSDIVRKFSNLESLAVLFADPMRVDVTPLIETVSKYCKSLKFLQLHANTPWTTNSALHAMHSLETLSLARCRSTIKASNFPKSLRHLEIIESHSVVMNSSLPLLESIVAIDVEYPMFIGGRIGEAGEPMYVRKKENHNPKLKTICVRNSRIVFFTTATTLLSTSVGASKIMQLKSHGYPAESHVTLQFEDDIRSIYLGSPPENGEYYQNSLYVVKTSTYNFIYEEPDDPDALSNVVVIKPDLY
jgi:hypothetical protein